MAKVYKVYATEKVFYEIGVVADSEEDAIKQVEMGNYSTWETIDGENFYIENAVFEEDL
jgi:hypothetical protein